ncbi:MAG: hypothetical protein E7Z78_05260 [Methanobrevibacter thaueri]|jgi:hypothetical protein|uniref:hypothetical protein n=1 Tax=Methanobrevibacter thaueri TaxID=190975 RepID=UPI0026F36DAE|nr:hypothetical protein [Methanobrevibacter thaueri]MBE6495835.1 hypothetical protein [Methanobrevibacter thaueri]
MPYDYYDQLKEQRDSEKYTETSDIIRKNVWNDSIDFQKSIEWMEVEDKIRIRLYLLLRYN